MGKYCKYLWYVIRHKWFVFVECCKVGLIWQGITHDMSKLIPSEFIPYARYFYGNSGDIKRGRDKSGYYAPGESPDEKFNIAWLHHQHRNPHHWQYWILRLDSGDIKVMNMPYKYIQEMVCDWKGAGRAITGSKDPDECKKWYLKNNPQMCLSRQTIIRVEKLLGITMN